MKTGTTDIIDIDEIQRKEKEKININKELELINTIKMEPIIEKTEIEQEDVIIKKAKIMKITDIILIILILALIIGFIIALVLIA